MAYIGMKHPVWAPINGYTPGQEIIYGAGVVLGKAVGADLTLERAEANLYADDEKAESDNSVTGGTISIEVDDLEMEAAKKAFGLIERTVNGNKAYATSGDASPYGGCGWMRTRKKNGVYSYVVMWVHRCQLGMSAKNSATKGEQMAYQTTTMSGDILGAQVDETLKTLYVDEIPMETEADAIALLDTLAHIEKPAATGDGQ